MITPKLFRRSNRKSRRTHCRNLFCEHLEDRRVLSTLVFNTSDNQFDAGVDNHGWWSDTAFNRDANDNYGVGINSSGQDHRNFFTFDLSSLDLSSEVVTSVTLELRAYSWTSPDTSETIEFFDVSTDAATLNSNWGTSATIYNDLGSGISYGAFTESPLPSNAIRSFVLNAGANAGVTAAAGDFFSVGGALQTIGGGRGSEGFLTNSGDLGIQRIVVETEAANQPPIAVDDTAATDEDMPVTIDVVSNDTDPDGNLDPSTLTATSGPSNGTLTDNGDGTFTYTPNTNWSGTDSFVYQVCDTGGLCDTATVSITVNPVVDALIDVKPGNGDEMDPINLRSKGLTPIAILTTSVAEGEVDDFDATLVDTTTIELNGVQIDPEKVTVEDVDGDGDDDLLLHFSTPKFEELGILDADSVDLVLTAEYAGGGAIGPDLIGSDDIKIVPKKGKKK